MKKITLSLIILYTPLTGCVKTEKTFFEIHQRSLPHLITYDEIFNSNLKTKPTISEETIRLDAEYKIQKLNKKHQSYNDIVNLIEQRNGVISGEEFPYIIAIPIYSTHIINNKKQGPSDHPTAKRCATEKNPIAYGEIFLYRDATPYFDGKYYQYTFYTPYNKAAAEILLNDIQDICIHYKNIGGGGGDMLFGTIYQLESNTLVIPAQEIKEALDYWNIPYDL